MTSQRKSVGGRVGWGLEEKGIKARAPRIISLLNLCRGARVFKSGEISRNQCDFKVTLAVTVLFIIVKSSWHLTSQSQRGIICKMGLRLDSVN